MKTNPFASSGDHLSRITGKATAFLVTVVIGGSLQFSPADIPDRTTGGIQGMYKIAASNDPIFPMQAKQEWFLDFGKGTSTGNSSGSVAVSLRQNPKVRVRIMAWQFFPKQGSLLIGNPYSEGSRKAVAMGSWQINLIGDGVIFQRQNYQVVLHRADPRDY